jgi:hypothetical protein
VRPHNDAALFAIFIVIGVCSVTLLPVAIELGVELTRNPDGSSAVLWFSCALCFFNQTAPLKTNLFCLKRKFVVYRLYIRSVARPTLSVIHSTSSHFISDLFTYFLVLCILRSARRSSRLSRSEPTAEYARRDHIQWRLGIHRRHTRFLPPRKTSTTRTGRANVRGARGDRCRADPRGRVSSKGVIRENMS